MSLTNIGLSDIGYLAKQADIAGQEMGASVAGLNTTTALTQPVGQSRAGGKIAYYASKADNGTNLDEGQGFVRLFGEVPSAPNPKTQKRHKALAKNGERMSYQMAKDLADGKHPTTGEVLVKAKVTANGKTKRKVGYDLQMSLPKSASILWGLGTAAAREGSNSGLRYAHAVDKALEEATQRVLQYCYDNDLIVTRRSGDRHGHESAAQVVAGTWRHSTSRSADMHCHTHNVLFNICLRNDGTTGGIDNAKLKMHGRALRALFEGHAGFVLQRECPELSIEKSGKSWEVGGVAEVLIDEFSQGRKRVLKHAKEQFGMDAEELAKHRETSTYINQNTRDKKENVPPIPELLPRWQMRAMAKGYTWQAIVEEVVEAGEKRKAEIAEEWAEKRAEAAERGEFLPETPPALDVDEITDKAFNSLTNSYSVFEEKVILGEIAEAMMTKAGIDTFEEVVARVQASGKMVALGQKGDTVYYSTREVIEKERKLLSLGIKMQGNRAGIDADVVERFISKGKTLENGKQAFLRDEQAEATRYACRGSQFVIVRGRPGTGKSFTSGVIADIHRDQGYEVHGIGPTHAAKDVLKDDAEIAAELARAVAGFILDYEKGKVTLGPSSLVLIDEFGMLGLDQTLRLLEILDETGAKAVGFGDDFQLQPISNGASMKQLSDPRICGAFTMGEIVRQSGWQREASLMMSDKRVADGVSEYMKMGKVHFHEDGETAAAKTVNDYIDYRLANPDKTAIMQAILNRSTSEMNMLARERLAELGFLEGPETVIKTWTRGMNSRKTDTGFCKNDLVILGEPFKYEGEVYANNLGGKILDIKPIEKGEPIFTIRWNDGRTTSLRPSEMVGYRPEKAKDKTTPKLAHGYARTVYSQQGSTYNATFTNIDATPSAELVNVLLTRHKDDAVVHVDGGRYHDDISARNGVKMSMNKEGVADEMSLASDVEVTPEMIREQFLKEVQRSQAKLNASDFHDDIIAFANGAEITRAEDQIKAILSWRAKEISMEEAIALSSAEDADQVYEWADRISAMMAAEERGENKMAIEDNDKPQTAADFRGARNSARARYRTAEEAVHPKVVETAERMEKKAAEVQERKASKPKKELVKDPARSRVAAEEIAYMARQDLHQLMLNDGATYHKKHRQARRTNDGGIEYSLVQPNGEKTVVKQWASGSWSFFNRGDQARGDIAAYVMWRDGVTRGEALHKLRDHYGTLRNRVETSELKSKDELRKEVPLQERLAELAEKPYDAKRFEDVRAKWDALGERKTDANGQTTGGTGMPGYALSRGLERETLEPFKNDFRLEGSKSFDGKNDRGMAIMMRDHDLNFTGFYRKGPQPKGELGIQGGSEHHATFMGNTTDPKRIYAGETPFDCWSKWQMDGRPDAGKVAISNTPGSYSHNAMADWMMIAKKHPEAEWHYCIQNDDPNEKTGIRQNDVHRQRFEEAVRAGNPNAVIHYHKPGEAFKDWNDQLRGITKADLAAKKTADVEKKPEPKAEEQKQQSAPRPQDYRPKPLYQAVRERKPAGGNDAQEAAARAEKARAEAEAQRRAQAEAQRQNGPKR